MIRITADESLMKVIILLEPIILGKQLLHQQMLHCVQCLMHQELSESKLMSQEVFQHKTH